MPKFVQPRFTIERPFPCDSLEWLERVARTCYRSEGRICEGSAVKLLRMLLKRGHMSIFEHISASVRVNYDLGVSREMNRHRLLSIAEQSTRYVDMDGGIEFIAPHWWNEGGLATAEAANELWQAAHEAERRYKNLRGLGAKPQDARRVLPLMTATETVLTTNLREWLHIFSQRCSKAAHPDLVRVMCALRAELLTPLAPMAEAFIKFTEGENDAKS